MDLNKASIKQVTNAIKQKQISTLDVAKHFLKRVEKINPEINAVITLNDQLLQQAKELDEKISKGSVEGKLLGIPVGIKDMLCTKGLRTTAASKILHNFVPPYDATVVEKIKQSGGLILGKLNQDEFAMGSSNENSCFGPCKNPWDRQRVPGGSSGGSAAAQAARLAMGCIGTDTGGSIRQPANFCGVVGIKPTYGRVSRYGVIAYASSLDQAGPMANTVEDAALILEIISGSDNKDGTCSRKNVPEFSNNIDKNVRNLRIGILKEFANAQINEDVQKNVEKAIKELRQAGAEIVELSIPTIKFAVPIYYLIAASEASSNLSRYDGVRYGYRSEFKDLSAVELEKFYSETRGEGFGSEVKRRIMLGTYFLSSGYYDAYYKKASQVRRMLSAEFAEAFKKCDVILSPVTTSPAFKIGEKISDPVSMYMNDIFTTATNLIGSPGMSVPFGYSKDKLPIGIQITSAPFEEQRIINVASFLEEASSIKGQTAYE